MTRFLDFLSAMFAAISGAIVTVALQSPPGSDPALHLILAIFAAFAGLMAYVAHLDARSER